MQHYNATRTCPQDDIRREGKEEKKKSNENVKASELNCCTFAFSLATATITTTLGSIQQQCVYNRTGSNAVLPRHEQHLLSFHANWDGRRLTCESKLSLPAILRFKVVFLCVWIALAGFFLATQQPGRRAEDNRAQSDHYLHGYDLETKNPSGCVCVCVDVI